MTMAVLPYKKNHHKRNVFSTVLAVVFISFADADHQSKEQKSLDLTLLLTFADDLLSGFDQMSSDLRSRLKKHHLP